MNDTSDPLARLLANPERRKQIGGKHYKGMVIQPMEFNHVNNIPYIDGNIIKYVSTWRFREGLQDLEKALHYLEFLIADEKAKLMGSQSTIKHMAPAIMDDGEEEYANAPHHVTGVGPGTPEDGGHHARQPDETGS